MVIFIYVTANVLSKLRGAQLFSDPLATLFSKESR